MRSLKPFALVPVVGMVAFALLVPIAAVAASSPSSTVSEQDGVLQEGQAPGRHGQRYPDVCRNRQEAQEEEVQGGATEDLSRQDQPG